MATESLNAVSLDDVLASLEDALVTADKALIANGLVVDSGIRKGMGNHLLRLRRRRNPEA
jgi:hypothetical protein